MRNRHALSFAAVLLALAAGDQPGRAYVASEDRTSVESVCQQKAGDPALFDSKLDDPEQIPAPMKPGELFNVVRRGRVLVVTARGLPEDLSLCAPREAAFSRPDQNGYRIATFRYKSDIPPVVGLVAKSHGQVIISTMSVVQTHLAQSGFKDESTTLVLNIPARGGGIRRVVVHVPPMPVNPSTRLVFLADGQTVGLVGPSLNQDILSGRAPNVIVVGIEKDFDKRSDYKADAAEFVGGEYKDIEQAVFARLGIPARSQPTQGRTVMGFSNGADWAIDVHLRSPILFSALIAASPASRINQHTYAGDKTAHTLLFVGSDDHVASTVAASVKSLALSAGENVCVKRFAGGHGATPWTDLVKEGLQWLRYEQPC